MATLLSLIPTQVLAVSVPDSMTITQITAYRGPLESTDILVVVLYDLEYSSVPTEFASDTFLGKFMNGTTELQSVQPVAYNDGGYNEGVLAFYWTESQVASLSITWEGIYTVTIEGNPSSFEMIPSLSSNGIDYKASIAARFHLTRDLRTIAQTLEDAWGGSTDLISGSPDGKRLTSDGQDYLGEVIDNLGRMAPQLMSSTILTPEYSERTFSQSEADRLLNFWEGTSMDDALQSLADSLGVERMVLSTLLLLAFTAVIAHTMYKISDKPEAGLLAVLVMIPGGALMGVTPMQFGLVIGALGVLGIGYVLLYKHA